ncbi:MAG: hypothetical protein JW901_05395 [Dehalococcoidia bacterium]|nr:hypothetical protein [Dehalococcoidia bacterium]
MKDMQLTHPSIFPAVLRENQRQIEKWGIQDHSPFEWLTYATEELGELANAISEHHNRGGDPEAVWKEAIQTATLCLKIAEMYIALSIKRQVEEMNQAARRGVKITPESYIEDGLKRGDL